MKVEFIHGDPSRPECGDMFGGWLTEYGGQTFLVDCGVGSGGPSLARRLKRRLNGARLDYVLLTHIHLDHSGGLASIFDAFPETRAVVHARGISHLAAPDRLWASTIKVMKELAETYGRPRPLDPKRLIPHTEAGLRGLKIFETPGHAPHHLSYRLGPYMFTGEAAGLPYYFEGRLYSRPATPPKYSPDQAGSSIEKLLREPDGTAYCGHYHPPVPLHDCLRLYQKQLAFWEAYLGRPEAARGPNESHEEHLARLTDSLIKDDPNLSPLARLSGGSLWVEKFFIANSIEGFLDYLESLAAQQLKA